MRSASVRHTGCCSLSTSPDRTKRGTRTTKQCAHIALCGTAGYCNFCDLSGGNRDGASARAITMDCLFLLIWTLPIPLVGCNSLKLLSILLSWNIIKACGTYVTNVHTIKSITCSSLVLDPNKQTIVSFLYDSCKQTGAGTAVTLIVVKSKTNACHYKLNSSCNTFQQEEPPLLPVGFHSYSSSQPVATCLSVFIFSSLFYFADFAHLLLTHLPHRVGQLFFQRELRIKSR